MIVKIKLVGKTKPVERNLPKRTTNLTDLECFEYWLEKQRSMGFVNLDDSNFIPMHRVESIKIGGG